MIHIENWDSIQEMQPGDFDQPKPGGYIAVIDAVTDEEEKQYLRIAWDFAEGPYKGSNQATFDRAGFWPTVLIRSYKEKALGFFKAFKTCVEVSNPGYTFNDQEPSGLAGKYVGVVLGEEEYQKKDGSTGTRLYVYQTRAVRAIREGDYRVPVLKKLPINTAAASAWPPSNWASTEDELPF